MAAVETKPIEEKLNAENLETIKVPNDVSDAEIINSVKKQKKKKKAKKTGKQIIQLKHN